MHRLVYAPPCVYTALPVAPAITRLLWWLQTAFCVHRLVCVPPSLCAALPVAPKITRLLRWLQTAFCVHHLVCAPPCVCTDLYVHRLVYARTCMWTTRLVNPPPPCSSLARQTPPPPACLVSAPIPPPLRLRVGGGGGGWSHLGRGHILSAHLCVPLHNLSPSSPFSGCLCLIVPHVGRVLAESFRWWPAWTRSIPPLPLPPDQTSALA